MLLTSDDNLQKQKTAYGQKCIYKAFRYDITPYERRRSCLGD